MIAAVLIRGYVRARKDVIETLKRLNLKRKFNLVILEERPEIVGMLKKVQHYVTYGKISEELRKELIQKYGEQKVYRLKPPRGGFKRSIKLLRPLGELGPREEMDSLIRRMM